MSLTRSLVAVNIYQWILNFLARSTVTEFGNDKTVGQFSGNWRVVNSNVDLFIGRNYSSVRIEARAAQGYPVS